MYGFMDLLKEQGGKTDIFYATSGIWQAWNKPIGTRNVYILCVGGGGGGQAGSGGTAGTTRAGGTGGASSGWSFGTFSANVLPDILYVNVGVGGSGGTGGAGAGGNGGAGSLSYVSVLPNTVTQNTLMRSGAAAAVATSGIITVPTAGTVWTFTSGYVLPFLGLVAYDAGFNGTPAGSTGGAGTSVTVSGLTTGGAAGGGVQTSTPNVGGDITGSGTFQGYDGGATGGGGGSGGFNVINPYNHREFNFFPGGAGGGAINSGTGGAGGNAAFGSGGGGGGAGTTGGRGGRGGDGLIVIMSW